MLTRLRPRLDHPTIVAYLALFIALGGGAYALSGVPDVTGTFHGCVHDKTRVLRVVSSASSCRKAKTIKRGTRRVRIPGESAITWNQPGRPGANGTDGTNGTNGTNGTDGTDGTDGTNGTTNLIVRTTSANGAGGLDASCNPGERAVGGGIGRTDGTANSSDILGGSFPTVAAGVPASNGSTANGWRGVWNSGVANVTTWVICASP
ncbi:MAG: hypothetical protein QOI98_3703 [Solirubrobacteraceae bacterium]|nr:hypothetical protein [Solirubrobacteraceae bacterium]